MLQTLSTLSLAVQGRLNQHTRIARRRAYMRKQFLHVSPEERLSGAMMVGTFLFAFTFTALITLFMN